MRSTARCGMSGNRAEPGDASDARGVAQRDRTSASRDHPPIPPPCPRAFASDEVRRRGGPGTCAGRHSGFQFQLSLRTRNRFGVPPGLDRSLWPDRTRRTRAGRVFRRALAGIEAARGNRCGPASGNMILLRGALQGVDSLSATVYENDHLTTSLGMVEASLGISCSAPQCPAGWRGRANGRPPADRAGGVSHAGTVASAQRTARPRQAAFHGGDGKQRLRLDSAATEGRPSWSRRCSSSRSPPRRSLRRRRRSAARHAWRQE